MAIAKSIIPNTLRKTSAPPLPIFFEIQSDERKTQKTKTRLSAIPIEIFNV